MDDTFEEFARCPKCGKTGTCGSRCRKRKARKYRLPEGVTAFVRSPISPEPIEAHVNGTTVMTKWAAVPKTMAILLVAKEEADFPNAMLAGKKLAKAGFSSKILVSTVDTEPRFIVSAEAKMRKQKKPAAGVQS